jgi:hypothetical protein
MRSLYRGSSTRRYPRDHRRGPMPPTDAALVAIVHGTADASSMAGVPARPHGTSALPELGAALLEGSACPELAADGRMSARNTGRPWRCRSPFFAMPEPMSALRFAGGRQRLRYVRKDH